MVEVGDGYRLEGSMVEAEGCASNCGGREGDLERTDRGDEERMEGVALRSERGEEGGDEDELAILAGDAIWDARCREMRASVGRRNFPGYGRVFAALCCAAVQGKEVPSHYGLVCSREGKEGTWNPNGKGRSEVSHPLGEGGRRSLRFGV